MPIKVTCKCGQTLNAKDELAGKTVRCPKCKEPLRIPAAPAAAPKAAAKQPAKKPAAKPAARQQAQKPAPQQPAQAGPLGGLDDLFEEGGLTAGPKPTCPECGENMSDVAVICVKCGYNRQTGKRLQGDVKYVDVSEKSNAEELVAKAAKRLKDDPSREENVKDWGDAKSVWTWLLLIFLPVFLFIAVGAALYWGGRFVAVQKLATSGADAPISIYFGLAIYGLSLTILFNGWYMVSISALEKHPFHGIVSLLTFGWYGFFWAMSSFKTAKTGAIVYWVGIGFYSLARAWMMICDVNEQNIAGHSMWILWIVIYEFGSLTAIAGWIIVTIKLFEFDKFQGYGSMLSGIWGMVGGVMNYKECGIGVVVLGMGLILLLISVFLYMILSFAYPLEHFPTSWRPLEQYISLSSK